jgi:acetylornithine aminotransferase/acetylornithine/N-succinyldiaminopimelate aminotransferase
MKEIVSESPAIVRNQQVAVQQLFQQYVVPSYGRFELALSHGQGSWLWDVNGKRYLDLGGGIAVNALGHAHPEIADTLAAQARKLVHISNLYYHEPQGRLAQKIVSHLAEGKVFFCNSGAEANEGLYKLARKFGHDEGRFEIITAVNSFHGRTLAGISATGQDKVKKGFEPMVPGFLHVPFNDLAAVRAAISPATVAVLIEGVQGEGGVTPATPEFLLGLRALCDEKKLLLLMDGVQCGHFRTGKFQSYQRILENAEPGTRNAEQFLPDGLSMAKSLGNGFPMGAFWLREPLGDLLGAGTHGTTYGGNLLGCAVALKVFEIIERDGLAENARTLGEFFRASIATLAQKYPGVVEGPRGLGLMVGIELAEKEKIAGFAGSDKAAAIQFVNQLHEAGLLTVPAGTQIVRLLPSLNLTRAEAEQGMQILESVVAKLA